MSEYPAHDQQDEGITRKGFLKGTALAGAGVVATLVGGKVTTMARRLSLSVAPPATLVLIPAATTQVGPHLKPPPALVRVAHDAALGQILVKANGRTLYHFSRDRNGKIGCTGTCTQFWFPLLVAKDTRIASVAPSIRTGIGVINRGAGQIQVTYRRQPLYTFIGDQQAGQTNGQGFKDFGGVWTVATVKASSSPGSSSGGNGGYGRY